MDFKLDPFQIKAIESIEQDTTTIVAAPTGAGKTVIAEAAIDRALEYNKSVIYTAPIKALSNQKYRDFRAAYGDEKVGILTGDVSLNQDAPILIMTTEIYRNSLFEHSKRIENSAWVIFDEIHYLDDIDRGTVWEEALLLTPPHISILALSATVPNVEELANWISSIHKRPVNIIQESHRPVPLHFIFQCQGRFFRDVKHLEKNGFHGMESWRVSRREKRRGYKPMRAKPNRFEPLIEAILRYKQLPAIYFAFGRRRVESLAYEAVTFNFLTRDESEHILNVYAKLLHRYDLTNEKSAADMKDLIGRGIAYHHAGMLPTLKEVVEQLFTNRLLKLVFTTETFALGINMPARTVIFDELEKFYGTGFKHLTTRDFFQMAGRAGRRGMDKEGHVYMRINPHHISVPQLKRMIYGKSETIRSQLNTTYATLLNLYATLGEQLLDIYPQTFHHFQANPARKMVGLSLIKRKLFMLTELEHLKEGRLTPKGEFAASLFGYELLTSEMKEEGVFEELNEVKLNILLSSLIFEPRKGAHLPRLNNMHKKLKQTADHYSRFIHRHEFKHKISPYIKPPHFHLAQTVEAWTGGADFDDLFKYSNADEGEIVRHFRMIIQLLRELIHAAHVSEKLKKTARNALDKINRDVVDAEKQLRV